jgi:hypothetical protein
MKKALHSPCLRTYRDLIMGRTVSTTTTDEQLLARFSTIREKLRMSQPPFRGERVRRTCLMAILLMTASTVLFLWLAGV